MQRKDVSLSSREATGKGPNRRLRSEGKIPAVIYGIGSEPEKVALSGRDFERMMAKPDAQTAILNLKRENGNGAEENAIVRELQRDPLTRRILHVDLFRINMNVENEFEVPIHAVGIPVGVREGGILETHLRSLQIRCLPANLPTAINVDVKELAINHSIHVSDVKSPEGVTIITNPEDVLFTVLPPKEVAAAVPAEAEVDAAAAQPEVIGKKKTEEEAK